MVKALILKTTGKTEVVTLSDLEDYQKYVGGEVRLMTINRGYVDPKQPNLKIRKRLRCYVNGQGITQQLPSNPFAGLLSLLGVGLQFGMFIFGDVIVLSKNTDHGDDKSIDPYVIDLVDRYIKCVDEEEEKFYIELEELNKPIKAKEPIVDNKDVTKSIKSTNVKTDNKKEEKEIEITKKSVIISTKRKNDDKKKDEEEEKGKRTKKM